MMNREKMMGDYTKTRNVIMSCDNMGQLKVGIKMFNQLNRLHELPEKDLDKLENLIGLMKLKCGGADINERSSIGQEFHKAAQSSGVQDLRSIVFSEDKDILKEINIGTQIEQNHLPYDEAKELATQNVSNVPNYYSDPNYCIIAVENKNGDKKTVRVEKSVYEKSKKGEEQLITDDMEIYHEDLDSNRISDMLRNKRKKENRRRESPREFEQIRRVRDDKPDFEDEIEEATGAASSGAFVGPMGGGTVRRVFKKSDIPTSKNGIVGKRQTGLPIGKLYSFNEDKEVLEEEITTGNDIIDTLLGIFIASRIAGAKPKEVPQYIAEVGGDLMIGFIKFMSRFGYSVDTDVLKTKWDGLLKKALRKYYKEGGVLYPMLDDAEKNAKKRKKDNYEEEELDEATTVGGVGGQYVTPKFWAKGKGNWRNRVKKAYPGGKFVNIKKKCKTYPYCDQGSGGPSGSPITLSDTSEMDIDGYFNEGRVIKTIKRGKLKIK